jgi:GNAT superfamily N-acetyltransferase
MQVTVQPLAADQLDEAERIFRLAFGTFLGVPEPLEFTGDCAYTRTRWLADPTCAWAAIADSELVGCNFAARWGSFGFFGPLSVRPDYWEGGIGRRLLDATMQRFADWQLAHAGLYTFAQSPKHLALYQRYGFAPHYLTAVAARDVSQRGVPRADECLSSGGAEQRTVVIGECRTVTDAIFAGLDVEREIRAVQEQALGDTLLLRDDGVLRGFAVCHTGAGSEAGSGVCYVKFAAVAGGSGAAERFVRLLELCERYATQRGAGQLVAGVNTAREPAYRALLGLGFRSFIQGVAMQRPSQPGFNRPDAWVLDDWR